MSAAASKESFTIRQTARGSSGRAVLYLELIFLGSWTSRMSGRACSPGRGVHGQPKFSEATTVPRHDTTTVSDIRTAGHRPIPLRALAYVLASQTSTVQPIAEHRGGRIERAESRSVAASDAIARGGRAGEGHLRVPGAEWCRAVSTLFTLIWLQADEWLGFEGGKGARSLSEHCRGRSQYSARTQLNST